MRDLLLASVSATKRGAAAGDDWERSAVRGGCRTNHRGRRSSFDCAKVTISCGERFRLPRARSCRPRRSHEVGGIGRCVIRKKPWFVRQPPRIGRVCWPGLLRRSCWRWRRSSTPRRCRLALLREKFVHSDQARRDTRFHELPALSSTSDGARETCFHPDPTASQDQRQPSWCDTTCLGSSQSTLGCATR